jgi:hypothetical protein
MTELEEAELRLRRARAQRQWAARQNDYELEQALARESHRCWVEVELLKARVWRRRRVLFLAEKFFRTGNRNEAMGCIVSPAR